MRRKRLERTLGSEGIGKITDAVAAAERCTSAQVAVVVREWTLPRARFGRSVDAQRVQGRAEHLFVKQGFDQTQERNAVMLYVSLAEHVAVVLGDKAINARVPQTAWSDVVSTLTEAARSGQLIDGICAAVSATGALLALEFPLRAVHRNELADAPVLG